MLFSYFCHLRRLVFDQSSPVNPISESRGGYRERHGQTDGRMDGRRTEILVSNIEFEATQSLLKMTARIVQALIASKPKEGNYSSGIQ